MNGIESLLSHPAVAGTARVLLHFLWQGAVIALLLAGARWFIPARDSARRFQAAVGALALMFLAPLITAVILLAREDAHHSHGSSSGGITVPVPEIFSPLGGGISSASGLVKSSVDPWLSALVLFWVAGVVVLSIRNLTSLSQVRILTRVGVSAPPAEWAAAFHRLRESLGVTRRVRLLGSRLVSVPTVVGWLRPVVLVPVGAFTGMHPHHLEAILAHELAHVRRHDYLVNLMVTLVETVLFYHPAVWWVSRQVRVERENCCDDIAVGLCGDALVYARALADLEDRRGREAQLTMGADGGSLLDRVSRLVGREPASGGGDRWVPGILVLLTTLGMLFLGVEARQSPTDAATSDEDGWNLTSTLDDGEWEAEYKDEHLTIRVHYGDGDWVVGKSLDSWGFTAGQVEAVLGNDTIDFDFPREAGTFHFKGEVTSRGRKTRAEGAFTFTPDPRYAERLEDMGYSRREIEDHQMELAAHDVTSGFISEIRDLGYPDIALSRLMEFRIHGITPDYVRGMGDAGYPRLPEERIVEFKIHGIDPGYVRGMTEAGYTDLSPGRIVEFKIHGITPDYVQGMADSGYDHLPAERIVEYKIHGIDPDYVRGMARAGYPDLSPERVVEFKIHGITPDYVSGMREVGFRDLTVDRLVEYKIHGIAPDYVRGLDEAGYADLPPERVVEFKIHGITPDYVLEMNRAFEEALAPKKMVEMKIHGVGPDLVKKLRDRIDDLTPDEVLEIKIRGIERYLERTR